MSILGLHNAKQRTVYQGGEEDSAGRVEIRSGGICGRRAKVKEKVYKMIPRPAIMCVFELVALTKNKRLNWRWQR